MYLIINPGNSTSTQTSTDGSKSKPQEACVLTMEDKHQELEHGSPHSETEKKTQTTKQASGKVLLNKEREHQLENNENDLPTEIKRTF